MDIKTILTVFASVFVAELGDKTPLATLLFAADKEISKMTVLAGAVLALIVTSAIGVLAGGIFSQHVNERRSGDVENAPLLFGQDAGLIGSIRPAGEIVAAMAAEVEEIIVGRLNRVMT